MDLPFALPEPIVRGVGTFTSREDLLAATPPVTTPEAATPGEPPPETPDGRSQPQL